MLARAQSDKYLVLRGVHVMTDTPPAAGPPPQPPPTPSQPSVTEGPPPQPPPTPSQPSVTEGPSRPPTARTRISATWVAVIVAALVVVLLLIFILQNTESVEVSYFTADGTMPLGVALLLAALGGILLAALVASLRIWQLRHRLKNQGK
jgi:uncharacterized integral membrane protein